MAKYKVRQAEYPDHASRQKIIEAATHELRLVYKPVNKVVPNPKLSIGILVVADGDILIGTAEYINNEDNMYIQGIAVHQDYRKKGVCRMLIEEIRELAIKQNYEQLSLCVIEETGNVSVFEKIGFNVINKYQSNHYIGLEGQIVTQVEMVKIIA